jgi:hypothetical protein
MWLYRCGYTDVVTGVVTGVVTDVVTDVVTHLRRAVRQEHRSGGAVKRTARGVRLWEGSGKVQGRFREGSGKVQGRVRACGLRGAPCSRGLPA